jgi:hypothetical protein
MRDIRSDLQERTTLIDEQIRAAYDQSRKILEQLQNERDAKIADLKSAQAMIAELMEFEQRSWGNVSPPSVPSSPLFVLADLFMHKLNEVGSMSREELVELAVKEGFFADKEQAVQGVHPVLVNLVRSELIRELPDGAFAPPTMSQAIKLRRVG